MGKYISVYRRRKEGKTDYKKRLALLKSGSKILVVRKSLKNMLIQITEYHTEGDKILVSASSQELSKYGWKVTGGNMPSAYLTGYLAAKKAVEKGLKDVIVDIGLNRSTKGSRLYSSVKGAIDGGLSINCNQDILPDEERVSGKHIADYAESIKKDKETYSKHFSRYIKEKIEPEKIGQMFKDTKLKIDGSK